MGRPERRLDPKTGPVQRFAFELRQLRQRAGGLSYRQLAKRAHYSATALSEAAAGEQLPSLAVTLAYVEACGGDRDVWKARWQALAAQLAPGDDDSGGARGEAAETEQAAPYVGLAAFQPDNADWFFGRDRLIDELATRLARAPFLAVFGASGSGKSSLLRAGLLPAVRAGRLPASQDWPTVLLTPGEHPLQELAIQVAALHGIAPGSLHTDLRIDPGSFDLAVRQVLAAKSSTAQLLLVVDQFEEVFTLCRDEGERAGFVAALLAAVARAGSSARVVLGIRADFYGRCADYPALVAALRDAQVLVGPMNPDELREVITQPAIRAELSVERALVTALIADVEGRPGALPLLSHALLETWRRRRGRTMTLAGYQATGGVRSAIAQTAEQLYGQLNPHQQAIAKNLFVRLTALGEGTEDTRRRVHRAELLTGPDTLSVQLVLDRLTHARLITLGTDSIEVAHESLIRQWPRLRQWLTDDRDSLRLHRRLTEAAIEWDNNGREDGFLYRGTRLAAWQDRPVEHLNTLERAFLDASWQHQASEHATSRRRTRLAVSGLSLALVAISVFALLAVIQRNQANDQRNLALSRQLAISAAAQLSIDPELSLLLAREAFKIMPTAEAEMAMRQAIVESRVRAVLSGHQGQVYSVAFASEGQRVASAGEDGTVRIWDPAPPAQPVVLRGHDGSVKAVAFSPDGLRVASAGNDGTVRIWDPTGRLRPAVLHGHNGAVNGVAFDPDGRRVVSAGDDGTVRIWDSAGGGNAVALRGHNGPVNGVAFSPDGLRVASAGDDALVRIWDPAGGVQPLVLRGHVAPAPVSDVAFSPDGLQVASAGDDGTVRIWDPAIADQRIVLRGHDRPVVDVAFSPDGQRVVSAGYDGTVRTWDPTGTGQSVVLRGHKSPVYAAAFSPDGQRVASAGEDGTVRLWDPTGGQPIVLHGHNASVGGGITFSPDGRRVVSASDDGTVRIWDLTRSAQSVVLRGHQGPVYAAAFSPDGQRVASAGDDGTVRLWDPTSGDNPVVLLGHERSVFDVAFSPDGKRVASASGDHTVRIWDSARSAQSVVLRGHQGPVYEIAFSSDGRWIASASDDGAVGIWDPTRGDKPVMFRGHGGPVGGVAVSSDGQVASAGYDGTVRIWDPTRGDKPVVLRGHDGPVPGVAFRPDGQRVASASVDTSVRIWDPTSGIGLVVLRGHEASVYGVAFSPDGQRVASASSDATVRVWWCEVCGSIDKVLTLAEKRSTRALTSEERATFLHQS